jgi:hypothetical protein
MRLIDVGKNPQEVEAEHTDHDVDIVYAAGKHDDDDSLTYKRHEQWSSKSEAIAENRRKQAADYRIERQPSNTVR